MVNAGGETTTGTEAHDDHPRLDALPEWPLETIGVLVTTAADEIPYAIPVSWPVRAGDRRILLSLRLNRGSLARLRERPAVALLILSGGDVALCARGYARVVTEPMDTPPEYAAVAIEVETIEDHRQGAFAVASGVQRVVLDESELDALRARVRTLTELAAVLG
jgi:hypothetical protein